jgi:MFS family permease
MSLLGRRSNLTRLCAATLFHFVAMGMFMSAVPLFVHDELGGTRTIVGLATASFFPAAVIARPFIGRGLDTVGRKPFLLGATGFMAISSLLYFPASSVWLIIVLSLVRGAAGAGFYTGAATMATDISPEGRRAETVTLFSLFLYVGFATGPAFGEWLSQNVGFGWVWGTATLLSACAFVLTSRLPETMPANHREVASRARFGLHGAAVAPGLIVMCAATGYTSITAFSPLYAREIGLGASGGLYATFAITILGVRFLSRKLADRHGRIAVALPGITATSIGLAFLALIQVPISAYAGIAIYGAGFALLFPALLALAADRVADHERGAALATFTVCFDIGGGVGTYLVGVIADNYGFGAGYGLPALLCALAATALATRTAARVSYAKTR